MINRRKFVALLSLVPLVGKSKLLAWLMPKDRPPLPPGYIRCNVCGEFNGSTDAKNLSGKNYSRTGKISVTCLCHGIPCPRCKMALIHRPVSNTYDPEANEIRHWPYFAGLMRCAECRRKGDTANPRGGVRALIPEKQSY